MKLRQGRIEKGLPVAELEVRTRISAKFLEALESDRRDLVPAGFFFRNWAVQYASALSLDRAEIEADVDRILSMEAPLPLPGQGVYCLQDRPRLHSVHRTQQAPRLAASLGILVLVVLGCS
ncbi:MAG: helix-turn-helix domain-containing protein, partial [Acidobacteriota bacterium]|nr:helix-turn-helix domain-containing protein [Acidobacteriota bacterium]